MRRIALASATGATAGLVLGYLVGYLAGQATRAGVELHQLSRGAQLAHLVDDPARRGAVLDIPEQRNHVSPGGGLPCQRTDTHEAGRGCRYVNAWAPDGRHDDDREDD